MAITGISAISGEQLIAAGALSARSAGRAVATTAGNSLQGLYNTVSSNSATWAAGAVPFPASITTGSTEVAIVTTGFQDNTATRPTLFISGTTTTNNYPRMLLSENHIASQTSKSGAFLADAFEFYTGKNGGSTKVLRIDSTGMSGNAGFLFNKAHYDMWNKYSAESGNYYTTANPSGFITGVPAGTMNESSFAYDASNNITAYNGSAFKAGDEFPQSATDAINVVTGNSGDWNSTTTTVSSNSASWGGSILPISAGPGVKIDVVDNTLVFSEDVTLLYSGTANYTGINLSEPASRFERIKLQISTDRPTIFEYPSTSFTNNTWPGGQYGAGWGGKPAITVFELSANDNTFKVNAGWHKETTATAKWTVLNVSSTWLRPTMVWGINRTASNV